MPESAQVIIRAAQLPEGICYQSDQERLNGFVAAMSGELPGNFSSVNRGSDLPSVNNRGLPWIRQNPNGSPDGTYEFWNGAWRRLAYLPAPGVICLWLGNASALDTLDGGEPGVATIYSGPFWEIVTELSAKFPLGVGTLPSELAVAVGATGGEEKHVLTMEELPASIPPCKQNHFITQGSNGTNAQVTTGGASFKSSEPDETFSPLGSGVAHNTMPPYVGVYFIRRTVRIYINASAGSPTGPSSGGIQHYFGGFLDPNGNVVGNVGDLYTSVPASGGDGSGWRKASNSGLDTGWI